MPQFQIHDADTGLKLLVEGDAAPTDQEAEQLVNQELSFLRTNLYHTAGNRFMLDVGPLMTVRRISDKATATINEMQNISSSTDDVLKAIDRANARAKGAIDKGQSGDLSGADLFHKFYDEEMASLKRTVVNAEPSTTERTLTNLEPNTLLLVAHGAEKGGLYSEGGQQFTLHNVAQILGKQSNDVQNIVNVACYGGRCEPAEYQAAFPNIRSIRQHDPTSVNLLSLGALQSGDYFTTNTVPGLWKKFGTNWAELPTWSESPVSESAAEPAKPASE